MRASVAVLGAAMVVATAVPGCSFHRGEDIPTVSTDDLQNDIVRRLTDAGRPPESVTCRHDLVGEVGKTSRCEVVMSATNSFEPVVTVTAVEGSTVKYSMSPAVSKEQLEQAVSRLLVQRDNLAVETVSCESGLDGKAGAVAHCAVGAGGVLTRRTVQVNRVDGLLMNFDVLPILTKTEVEQSLLDQLARQLGQRPDSADCAGELEGRPGATIRCTVVGGSETGVFLLTVTGVQGKTINYRYQAQN